MALVPASHFDADACEVARSLVGMVLRRRHQGVWLAAAIVEAEAYYLEEKGSHASLGRTPSREALFMPPGTLYLYYARGGDSLNISVRGEGNAVLVKSGRPYVDRRSPAANLEYMHQLNPGSQGRRPEHRLCAGQTLSCRALNLKVPDWDRRLFDPRTFYLEDVGDRPELIRARRLGIPVGRDEHLLYRFVDARHLGSATKSPLGRGAIEGRDYQRLAPR